MRPGGSGMRPSWHLQAPHRLAQDYKILMGHRPVEAERSHRETAFQRFNGPCANRPIGETQPPAEFGQYPVRLHALAPDDVVGDDVNGMATRFERLPAMAEGRFQVGVESAE